MFLRREVFFAVMMLENTGTGWRTACLGPIPNCIAIPTNGTFCQETLRAWFSVVAEVLRACGPREDESPRSHLAERRRWGKLAHRDRGFGERKSLDAVGAAAPSQR